jgi:DNA-binding NarL/FixJ family response regulator
MRGRKESPRVESSGPALQRKKPPMDAYRIVLADDHYLIREGLRSILEESADLQVAGEASDGLELLFLLDRLKPHLVILDISMPNLQGIETARQIKMRYPGIKILILTMHQESEYLYEAISAGAEGYLLKEDAEKDLLFAIETIRRGKGFLSPILKGNLEEKHKLLPEIVKFLLES